MKENDNDNTQPPIIGQLKEYASTYLKLAKYEAIDKSSAVLGEVIADIVQVVCILFVVLFGSLTLAFLLAHIFQSDWIGFGIVFGLYVLTFLAVKIFKNSIEKPIVNAVIRKFTRHLS